MTMTAAFDLFLDESGLFTETSTDPAEHRAAMQQPRCFPSQLAGLLAPRGDLTTGKARAILNEALAAAGLTPQSVHANRLSRDSYDAVVRAVVERVRRAGWQPVRLVNRERVRYGDRVSAYTNLVAELVLRVCQRTATAAPQLTLRLFAARVRLDETPAGELLFLERDEYLKRIREYQGFLAVRRGLAKAFGAWHLAELHIRSGKDDAEIQLCDILSHASHDDFHPCQPATADALREAFGAYDFSLALLEPVEVIDQQLAAEAPGLALISLAEVFCGGDIGDDLRTAACERLTAVRDRLAGLGPPARDPHLALVSAWLEQIIEVRRAVDLGYRLSTWLLDEVAAPLVAMLAASSDAGSFDWFTYALRTWALTAANHRGAVRDARRQSQEIERLLPAIAGQWEHATLLMRGLVAQGVHLTDGFEHDRASARMGVAAQYYGELGSLFQAAMPEVFPARVRSDLHGRALGTWLQSEIHGGLCRADAVRLDRAREISERAIDEFSAEADKERQYQYRSQLEAAAGTFPAARRYLAQSLRATCDSHDALASAIAALAKQSAVAQGFAQLHWFRLGVTACLDRDASERSAFLAAVERVGALDWSWSRADGLDEYPAHGIVRRVAVIHGLLGQPGQTQDALRRLARLVSGDRACRVVLQTVRLAAHAEAAAEIAPRHAKQARRILDSDEKDGPGLKQQLRAFRAETDAEFPAVWAMFQDWPNVIEEVLHGDPATKSGALRSLVGLARRIGY